MEKILKNVQVNRILYEGHERLLPNPLVVNHADLEATTGGYRGDITGYKCPRCGKSQGYLFFTKHGVMYFCADMLCLKIDSEASRGQRIDFKVGAIQDAAMAFGLGSRYLNACLTKCNANPEISKMITKWLKDAKNMAVIVGPTNTGKTYFSMAFANYFLDQKINVKYVMYRRFFEEIQKAISKNENQYSIIEKLAECEVLIIDDVGASTNSVWQQEMFLDLIDRRYSNEKITIVTTNFTEIDCKEHLGERTSRRMFAKENLVIELGPEYAR